MNSIFLVGLGGSIGSIARYKLGGLISHITVQKSFPYSTFVINVLGCLIIGLLAGLAERYNLFSQSTRLFLFTGLLGGFTTFSAFGLDAILLVLRNEWITATLYTSASVILGITAIWLGLKIISALPH